MLAAVTCVLGHYACMHLHACMHAYLRGTLHSHFSKVGKMALDDCAQRWVSAFPMLLQSSSCQVGMHWMYISYLLLRTGIFVGKQPFETWCSSYEEGFILQGFGALPFLIIDDMHGL